MAEEGDDVLESVEGKRGIWKKGKRVSKAVDVRVVFSDDGCWMSTFYGLDCFLFLISDRQGVFQLL